MSDKLVAVQASFSGIQDVERVHKVASSASISHSTRVWLLASFEEADALDQLEQVPGEPQQKPQEGLLEELQEDLREELGPAVQLDWSQTRASFPLGK
jgi:hypothetical protein